MSLKKRPAFSLLLASCLTITGCNQEGGIAETTYNTLTNSETRVITERKPPELKDATLQDDRLEDKHPTFDPNLVDRRKVEDWEINLSEAITALNIPIIQPDYEADLLGLWPSYGDLQKLQQAKFSHIQLLPSVNMLDGKAKQFDDGLYAALEQAYLLGNEHGLASHEQLIRQWLADVPENGEAANFLKAGLKLLEAPSKDQLDIANETDAVKNWLEKFERDELSSKPISFYTWNDTLRKSWRFGTYFQQNFAIDSPIVTQLSEALKRNEKLKEDYRKSLSFYASVTNPLLKHSLLDAIDSANVNTSQITQASLFPKSTSRETELFKKIFAMGIPRETDLMMELVKRIRSGEVDLTPRPQDAENPSGWYDYQVYALETLLVADKGEEHNKLLLSKTYKQRMLDAFKALVTKRRETHAKQLGLAPTASAAPAKPKVLQPRLRVEPAPTYYLRTARSYQFLQTTLLNYPGEECLKTLKGLKQDGDRGLDLASELEEIKHRFYGLYLLSCEDIGLRPQLMDGEVESESACYEAAEAWLKNIWQDADFATDTRVSVPIATDGQRNITRLWVTVGVRLAKLDARYATAPKIRVAGSVGEWQEPEGIQLSGIQYLIPVDEFIELEVPGMKGISREELRSALPSGKTREEVLANLKSQFGSK